MFKLKNYIWAIIVASGIFAVAFSNVCCTGKASNSTSSSNDMALSEATTEAPGSIITLTESNFNDHIKKGVILVDFWATWCRPCRMQGPIIEQISSEMSGKITVGKLDVDQNQNIASLYGVRSIPTMIIFKDGKIAQQFLGYTDKQTLIDAINKIRG